MAGLEAWENRTPEERSLFNPAFLGALIFDFTKEHQKSRADGTPLTYTALALGLALHKPTRERLPSSTITSMYEWIQSNEDLRIGLDGRISGVMPYFREAFMFMLGREMISFADGHNIRTNKSRGGLPAAFLQDATTETKEIAKQMKFLARWFAKSGSETSVLAGWGVKP
ncbi:three component ABC system middle component [Salibaculum halophilum]|uniref:three component ABC system middle component n=1 Tax=Salibaculum halophilum TaxID=1914408 RepID=UPI001179EEA8|nr:three component ABC system middle component [Salibaculum halophilum]